MVVTKSNRIENNIEKSHVNDAFVVSSGSKQIRCGSYFIEQKRRNNRCLQTNRSGFAPSIRKQRYKIQPQDIVVIKGFSYIAKGVFNKGDYVRVENVKGSTKTLNFKCSLIEKYFNQGTFVWN